LRLGFPTTRRAYTSVIVALAPRRLGIQFHRAPRHSRCNLSRKAAIIASSAEQKM
jgi:hypothetical protein